MSCFVFYAEIPQTIALHPALVVSSKSSQWVGVHWLDSRLFRATMWKLLIIESFSQWKLNKIKTENCIGIWGCSWCSWNALDKSDFIEFSWGAEDSDFWVDFLAENSNKLENLGLEGKLSWALGVLAQATVGWNNERTTQKSAVFLLALPGKLQVLWACEITETRGSSEPVLWFLRPKATPWWCNQGSLLPFLFHFSCFLAQTWLSFLMPAQEF